ncbi:MAG: hypothetical protein OXF94_03325, partial [Gammaproteobacteria bacterium]|nr:hypothetical protein [Gammaproteobacteria bacterium]
MFNSMQENKHTIAQQTRLDARASGTAGRIEEGPLFGYASAPLALSAGAATREVRNTSKVQRDQGHLQLWLGPGTPRALARATSGGIL